MARKKRGNGGVPMQRLTPLYDAQQYQDDKLLGIRMDSGAAKLEKLKPVHRQIFALHMSGYSNNDVARAVGKTPSWVSTVINDPLMQTLISQVNDDLDGELRALFPMALDTLRKGMNSEDKKIALRASDQFFRTQGKYREAGVRDQTAEDVIRQILEIHSDGPVSIKMGTERKAG